MSTNSGPAGPLPAILRPAQIPAHERGGGVRSIPLVTREVGAAAFINGITIFQPDAAVASHSHNCDESVMILEGRAFVELDGLEYEVGPGDTTFLPANVPHRFRNASGTDPLRLFWTYASVNATRTIIATGLMNRIEDEHRAPAASDRILEG